MEFRWLTDDEILTQINPTCRNRGWAELNVNPIQPTCRVLGAFQNLELVGFFVFQLFPMLGPAWVNSNCRDGTISRELVTQMSEFLRASKARGYLVVCEEKWSERMCQRFEMAKVEHPVYIHIGANE